MKRGPIYLLGRISLPLGLGLGLAMAVLFAAAQLQAAAAEAHAPGKMGLPTSAAAEDQSLPVEPPGSLSGPYVTRLDAPLQALFSGTPTTGVAPLLVTFSNISTGDPDTCNWNFGDGGTLSNCNATITHTYAAAGVYTVGLTVAKGGNTDTNTQANYITASALQADFMGSPTSGVAPLVVNFTNTSAGNYNACNWAFGDGGTSTNCANPSHSYAAGVYTVSLTVSGAGGSDTRTRPSYITAYQPVQADFSGSPTSGLRPLTVNFTNLSSGAYTTCNWSFGDGGASSNCTNPSHQYTISGVYTVSLSVSGPGGSDSQTKTSYITVIEPPPTADFTAAPTSGPAPLTVVFTNTSTGGQYTTCSWTFGDGGTSTACVNPSHQYPTVGAYTVSLSLTGPGGSDSETKANYITVYERARASFVGAPTSGLAPLTVAFTNTSTGNYNTCAWKFGDGGTSTNCANPSHPYAAGVYTVSLSVSGLGGSDTLTRTNYITAYEPVQAVFSGSPTSGPAPLKVNFTNNSTGAYNTCNWTFGDGGTSTNCSKTLVYTYTAAGVYTVSLSASGPGGSDILTRANYITVYQPAQADFIGSPTSGLKPLTVNFTNLSSGAYTTCNWTFGDGGTSTNCADPSHQYTASGAYTVSLRVSGLGGTDVETKTNYINVAESLCAVTQVSHTPAGIANDQPSISSSGGRIAFVSDRDGNREIFLYATTGPVTETKVTSTSSGVTNEQPTLSGDGDAIAFASDASTLAGNPDGNQEIFRYDVAAGAFLLLNDSVAAIFPGFNLAPSISFSGTRIAFMSDHNLAGANPDGNPEIFLYQSGSSRQVSAGLYHACEVRDDGTLTCWGHNASGQATPPDVVGPYTQVSAGGYHTCGTRTNGSLACWGYNAYGQAAPPDPVGPYTQISAGAHHTCGVRSNGSVACWGYPWDGQTSPPDPVGPYIQVSAGGYHTCGLRANGSLACWGANWYGQAAPPDPVGPYTQVSAGLYHTCGVRDDGALACWGLGSPTWPHLGQATPPNGSFSQVSAGGFHTCGVRDDSTLACWGYNGDGQIVPPSGGFGQVSAGGFHTCGVQNGGRLACWGANAYGQAAPPSPPGHTTLLTQSSLSTNQGPSLSADGRTVAFVSNGRPRPGAPDAGGNPEVFIYNLTTQAITQVTASPITVTNSQPSLSADGRRLAFVSDGKPRANAADAGGNPEIFIYDVAADRITRVTTTPVTVENSQPTLSGDGQRLAFVSDGEFPPKSQNGDHNPEIFMALLGTASITYEQVTSTSHPVINRQPSLDRLGRGLTFVSDGNLGGENGEGNPEIYLGRCELDLPPVDLKVSKSAISAINVGGWFSYTIVVTNTGAASAYGVVLSDTLPPEVAFYVHSRVPACSYHNSHVACYFDELPAGLAEAVTIWVQATSPPSATNTVWVTPANPDQTPGDNRATATTVIGEAAYLDVTKVATPSHVTAGQPVTYKINLRNRLGLTTDVGLTDILETETGINALKASPQASSGTCTPWVGNSFTCNFSALAAGSVLTVTVTITPQQEGVITNTVVATGTVTDPEGINKVTVKIGPLRGVFLPIILKDK